VKAETALYSELERLSSAWETLDRELKGKIFDLTALEEKVNRANAEVCTAIGGCLL
jgi:E3 ubiquitin-protein ligase BRE1